MRERFLLFARKWRSRSCAGTALIAILLLAVANPAQQAMNPPLSDAALLAALTADFAKLAPQTIHPAAGVIQHPYLTPGKRVVFPSGIRAGLRLTMLSWMMLRERGAAFVEVGRWQRSGG
jgi:hypothetical protein